MSEREFTLAIETAVQGGSISLLQGNTELDYWIGMQEISKSEDILDEIKKILERNDLKKNCIKKIVVSRGPGSFTGMRIGMSIGYALKKALNCELAGVSVLKAMTRADTEPTVNYADEVIIAIPIGSKQICRQVFNNYRIKDKGTKSQPRIIKIGDFLNSLDIKKSEIKRKIILHQKLYRLFRENNTSHLFEYNSVINAGENIAGLIGKTITINDEYPNYFPIYIRDDLNF